jgi:hypothetical protein
MRAETGYAIAAPAEARQAILDALSRAGWRATAGRRNLVIAQPPSPLDEHDLIEFTFAMGAFGAARAFERDDPSLGSVAA